MGTAGLKELLSHGDRFDVTVLVRDTKQNRRKLAPMGDKIRIV